MEKTLVLIKPDGVKKKIIGKIISMYEEKGLVIEQIKVLTPTEEVAKAHYGEFIEKPFFGELIDFITSGKVVSMVISGEEAIKKVRKIHGATNPLEAEMGSIRALYAESKSVNCVHASDSPDTAKREISLWFPSLGEEN